MDKETRKFIIDKLKGYKKLKADIKALEIKIEEQEEQIIGISAQPQGERVSQTYKITSSVETQAIKYIRETEELKIELKEKERELAKIDNALTLLTDKERTVIEEIYIEKRTGMYCKSQYDYFMSKYYRSYSWIKDREYEALEKLSQYLG